MRFFRNAIIFMFIFNHTHFMMHSKKLWRHKNNVVFFFDREQRSRGPRIYFDDDDSDISFIETLESIEIRVYRVNRVF